MINYSNNVYVEINNGSIFFDNDTIISNINLKLYKGELVYLYGKTGSGKSTFLKSLYVAHQETTGDISVLNFKLSNIKEKNIALLRKNLGVILQDLNLLSTKTVFENLKLVLVALGWKNQKQIRFQAEEVLNKVGMVHKIDHYPSQLSSGEHKKICIARALINNPSIIIADEPNSNLDFESSKAILNVFSELTKQGLLVIIATHDALLLKEYTGRILFFENDKIIEN